MLIENTSEFKQNNLLYFFQIILKNKIILFKVFINYFFTYFSSKKKLKINLNFKKN